ncbi:MAG: gamma-glutamyl-gamma-aminobutyrate hydrolase family protein [Hyphomonadaceae bacterium]|jgi:GMP synthase-like glutamine amidotransferase|nr:gamma-glutamyl-gamma-aminobutyrate hydrolase family protein [Hyphomonadaceae bacterium]
MKLTIFETGRPPAPVSDRWPRYPVMLESLLSPHLAIAAVETIAVGEGEALPPVEQVEAVLITGSPSGVYDPLPWIQPLKSFVRRAAAASVPQVGICFGHQLLAAAFGGHVAKAPQGWGIGRHTYAVSDKEPWMECHGRNSLHMAVSHQDQVLEKPDVASVLASSDFTPYAALMYRHAPALSFQGHPEFDPGFARDLIASRRGIRFGEKEADAALESLAGPLDNAVVGSWIAGFYRHHLPGARAQPEAVQAAA